MLPVSSPWYLLVGGTGAVFAIIGLVILFTLRRSLEVLERRWAESFRPDEPPTEGAPTPGLVAGAGLVLLAVGGGIALLAWNVGTGALDTTGLGNTATVVIGTITTVAGLIGLLVRSRLPLLFGTAARSYRRSNPDDLLTPGVTLGICIVVTAIGVLVLLYGLFGN